MTECPLCSGVESECPCPKSDAPAPELVPDGQVEEEAEVVQETRDDLRAQPVEDEPAEVQPAQDDKDTPADSVMWTLDVPVPVTVYLDFWGGDHHVNNLRVGNDWLQAETSQWVRQPDEVGTMFWTEAETPPGPVFARTFPAGQIEIMGNGGSECSPCIGVGGHGTFFPFVEANC